LKKNMISFQSIISSKGKHLLAFFILTVLTYQVKADDNVFEATDTQSGFPSIPPTPVPPSSSSLDRDAPTGPLNCRRLSMEKCGLNEDCCILNFEGRCISNGKCSTRKPTRKPVTYSIYDCYSYKNKDRCRNNMCCKLNPNQKCIPTGICTASPTRRPTNMPTRAPEAHKKCAQFVDMKDCRKNLDCCEVKDNKCVRNRKCAPRLTSGPITRQQRSVCSGIPIRKCKNKALCRWNQNKEKCVKRVKN